MLRTLREIMEQDGLVPMRIGVNTGKVFTGDFGPPYRRAYRVFGDAINTAARVMSKADAGQILSTEIVLNRSRTIFDVDADRAVRGQGQVRAGQGVHRRPGDRRQGLAPRRRGAARPRGASSQTLLDAVEARPRRPRARSSRSPASPGMGKTRLIEEAHRPVAGLPGPPPPAARSTRRRRRTSRSGRSSAPSSASTPTRTPTRSWPACGDAVERLDAELVAVDPAARHPARHGPRRTRRRPPPSTSGSSATAWRRSRCGSWPAACPGRPTIFVIEDAQHLDEAVAGSAAAPLAGRRGSPPGPHRHPAGRRRRSFADPRTTACAVDHASSWRRSPLEALIAIIDAATEDDPLRPHEVEEIARRSGGNPLFLFELLDTVRATGDDRGAAGLDRVADRRRDRPPRPGRPDDPALRRGPGHDASIRHLLVRRRRGRRRPRRRIWAPARRPVDPRAERRAALPEHADPRRRLRGPAVSPAPGPARPGRRDDRGDAPGSSSTRRSAPRAPLLRGAALGQGVALLPAGRRPRDGDLRQRRGHALLRDAPSAPAGACDRCPRTDLAALYELSARHPVPPRRVRCRRSRRIVAARRLLDKDPIQAGAAGREAGDASRPGRRALAGACAGSRARSRRSRVARAERGRQPGPAHGTDGCRASLTRTSASRASSGASGRSSEAQTRATHGRPGRGLQGARPGASARTARSRRRPTRARRSTIYEELGDLGNQALVLNNLGVIAQDSRSGTSRGALYGRGSSMADRIGDRSSARS